MTSASKRRLRLIAAGLVLAIGSGAGLAAEARGGSAKTVGISISSHEAQANGESGFPSISLAGRYVAFHSDAGNLVRGDTNGEVDVFIRDRNAGTTRRVSVSSAGRQANGASALPKVSGDGRFIAFYSTASNLVRRDTNGETDVFLHDRRTHRTARVNVSSSGAQANEDTSTSVAISANGRFVAFSSLASNLVGEDQDNGWDAFVHDRRTGTTELVSVSSDGAQVSRSSFAPSISAKGRFVAFDSSASRLVPGDTNWERDVFVHDRRTGRTERVSVSSTGEQGEAFHTSDGGSISADGRFVAFESIAPNLVPGDANEIYDIFVHDRETGRTRRVSVDSSGVEANRGSYPPAISANGRVVTFASAATNLVRGDTNRDLDVFVHDRRTGRTRRASLGSRGSEGNRSSARPAISGAGRLVAFESRATNLVRRDTNRATDIFVRGPLR
jgi:Tol biopolymer transport system component